MLDTILKHSFALCFAVDKQAAESGFYAAASALRQWSAHHPLQIFVAYDPTENFPAKFWSKGLSEVGKPFNLHALRVNLGDFKCAKSIFGSHMTYARTVVPEIIDLPIVLYADADMIFLSDPADLVEEFIAKRSEKQFIGMVAQNKFEDAPPRERQLLLSKPNASPLSAYYHASVAVIDANMYKTSKILTQIVDAVRHPEKRSCLYNSDQTLWNYVISDESICSLDHRWNQLAYPNGSALPGEPKDGIVHFIGSPKPWDLAAEFFHVNAHLWSSLASSINGPLGPLSKYTHAKAWWRAWRIRRQYSRWF